MHSLYEFQFKTLKVDDHLKRCANRTLDAILELSGMENYARAKLGEYDGRFLVEIHLTTLFEAIRVRVLDHDPYSALRRSLRIMKYRLTFCSRSQAGKISLAKSKGAARSRLR